MGWLDNTIDDVKDAVDDTVDKAQDAAKDVAEKAGVEEEVDAIEDSIQRETGVDLGGSGGGRNNPDVNQQGSDDPGNRGNQDSVVPDFDGGSDSGGGGSSGGSSGGGSSGSPDSNSYYDSGSGSGGSSSSSGSSSGGSSSGNNNSGKNTNRSPGQEQPGVSDPSQLPEEKTVFQGETRDGNEVTISRDRQRIPGTDRYRSVMVTGQSNPDNDGTVVDDVADAARNRANEIGGQGGQQLDQTANNIESFQEENTNVRFGLDDQGDLQIFGQEEVEEENIEEDEIVSQGSTTSPGNQADPINEAGETVEGFFETGAEIVQTGSDVVEAGVNTFSDVTGIETPDAPETPEVGIPGTDYEIDVDNIWMGDQDNSSGSPVLEGTADGSGDIEGGFRDFSDDVQNLGLDTMNAGQDVGEEFAETVPNPVGGTISTAGEAVGNEGIQDIGDGVGDVEDSFQTGVGTAGTQAAGFFTAGAGGIMEIGADSVEEVTTTNKVLPEEQFKRWSEGAAEFGKATADQVGSNPVQFIASEGGEEVSEAVVGGLLFGAAGVAAGAAPTIEPEVEPETEIEQDPDFNPEQENEPDVQNLEIEVTQGSEMNRADSLSTEVDEEGNIISGQDITRTGEVRGVDTGQETVFESEQPWMTAIVKNTETGETEGIFAGSASTKGTAEDGSAEGFSEILSLQIDQEGEIGNPGNSQKKIVDFEIESEQESSEEILKIQREDGSELRFENIESEFEGQVGGTEITGRTETDQQVDTELGKLFASESASLSEGDTGSIGGENFLDTEGSASSLESQGGIINQEALEGTEIQKIIRPDEGTAEGDPELDQAQAEELVQDAQDIFGTDFSNFMETMENEMEEGASADSNENEMFSDSENEVSEGDIMQIMKEDGGSSASSGEAENTGIGFDQVNQEAFKEVVSDQVTGGNTGEPDFNFEPETETDSSGGILGEIESEAGSSISFEEADMFEQDLDQQPQDQGQEQDPGIDQMELQFIDQTQETTPEQEEELTFETETEQEQEPDFIFDPNPQPEPEPEPEPEPGFGGDNFFGEISGESETDTGSTRRNVRSSIFAEALDIESSGQEGVISAFSVRGEGIEENFGGEPEASDEDEFVNQFL